MWNIISTDSEVVDISMKKFVMLLKEEIKVLHNKNGIWKRKLGPQPWPLPFLIMTSNWIFGW